ncbi:MAG TPA: acetyl-CoA C-acyltransferase, partial [Polyangiales bacterium]
KVLLKANRAKSPKDQALALTSLRLRDIGILIPNNGEPRTGLSMGDHCELMAKEWKIPRSQQDELAAASHAKLAKSYEAGFHDDLVSPFKGLSRDGILRPDTNVEKLAKLKPAYDKENGTLTAGNSTALTDGASAVLLATEAYAKKKGWKVRAYFVDAETAAVDFAGPKKEGLLMAPAYAVPRLLARNGLKLQDFDFYEIHEAFAAQVLCTLRAWESASYCKDRLGLDAPLGSIDLSKLNVNGSSLATGHPFAATGGRIVAALAKLLEQKGTGRGLISICAAGGQGVTAILER